MAERNLSIRLSVVDGGKVKAELSEIGEKGERSLKKIESAATPASSGLKLLSSAANDAKFQLQAATDRLGMLGSVLGKLGPAGLIAGASIAALGVGITALVMPVARVGDEFFKLSQKTGVSVEALTALDYAAKLSDVTTEGLTKALQKLSVAMFDTQVNGEEGSAALRALGVSATDAHGQIRPTEADFVEACAGTSTMVAGKLLKRLGILDCENGKHKKRHLLGGLGLPVTFYYSILVSRLMPEGEQAEVLAAGPLPTTGFGPRLVQVQPVHDDDDDLEAVPNF